MPKKTLTSDSPIPTVDFIKILKENGFELRSTKGTTEVWANSSSFVNIVKHDSHLPALFAYHKLLKAGVDPFQIELYRDSFK